MLVIHEDDWNKCSSTDTKQAEFLGHRAAAILGLCAIRCSNADMSREDFNLVVKPFVEQMWQMLNPLEDSKESHCPESQAAKGP